jgi:multidrug efflux pump subunit AcrA (membrane-fusion protein)
LSESNAHERRGWGPNASLTRGLAHAASVFDEPLTTGALLEQWRDATRAAELAERLAKLALASATRSDRDAQASQEIARIAERAAKSAERTAQIAREASERAQAFAAAYRLGYLAEADAAVVTAQQELTLASDRYHDAERADRESPRGPRPGECRELTATRAPVANKAMAPCALECR